MMKRLFPNQYVVRSAIYVVLVILAMVLQADPAVVVGCLILARIESAEGRR